MIRTNWRDALLWRRCGGTVEHSKGYLKGLTIFMMKRFFRCVKLETLFSLKGYIAQVSYLVLSINAIDVVCFSGERNGWIRLNNLILRRLYETGLNGIRKLEDIIR